VDLNDLKEILRLVDESSVTEFELEEAGTRLRIRKAATLAAAGEGAGGGARHGVAEAKSVVPAGGEAAELASAAPGAQGSGDGPGAGVLTMSSPIVGTFYRSPDPNSPAFVKVGDRVQPGQVLCIVEAMKLMNEIEAEIAGEIVKVYPANGEPVQYGAALFDIRREG